MKVLKLGSVGPSVELLQLALGRAGARSLAPDGIFGNATKAALRTFQSDNGLAADGVAGPATHRALMPYYTGFASHRIHRGDTLFALSDGIVRFEHKGKLKKQVSVYPREIV